MGGRCDTDDIKMTSENGGPTKACATIYGWPHATWYKGGARAEFELCATVEGSLSEKDKRAIIEQCEEDNRAAGAQEAVPQE